MSEYLEKIKKYKNNPSKLGEIHLALGYRYAEISSEYEELIPEICKQKRKFQDEFKTVARADREFEMSSLGQIEKSVKYKLKSLEKLMSSIKRRLDTLDMEAHNQY